MASNKLKVMTIVGTRPEIIFLGNIDMNNRLCFFREIAETLTGKKNRHTDIAVN